MNGEVFRECFEENLPLLEQEAGGGGGGGHCCKKSPFHTVLSCRVDTVLINGLNQRKYLLIKLALREIFGSVRNSEEQ